MRVALLPTAERDLTDLFVYVKDELKNPIAANNIVAKLLRNMQMLEKFPELGKNLVNVDPRLNGYRYLLVNNYLVVYSVTEAEICIVRVLYARSDYIQMLQGS